MIKIPHLPPMRFAQELVEKVDENTIIVCCKFDTIPSLATLVEAAAQASAGFSEDEKKGFLIQVRDVTLNQKIEKKQLYVYLKMRVNITNTAQFDFTFFAEDRCEKNPLAAGSFSIYKK